MSEKVQASARVQIIAQITVEFSIVGQAWSKGAPSEQVIRQAREVVREILKRGLSSEGEIVPDKPTRGEIVGDPKVSTIYIERQP